jgi:CBS domain-containing protein
MKTAHDIISQKPHGFNYVEPEARVVDALNLLNAMNRSFLVVTDDGGYRGVFCERDYLRNVAIRGWDPNVVQVQDVMSTNFPTVAPDESIEHVMQLVNAHHARYVPVFDGHHFEGVITLHDLLRILVNEKEEVFDHTNEPWSAVQFG